MTIKDKELGPDNKEAGNLMMALHNTVDSKNLKYYKDEMGDEDSVAGVGKDIFGKYSFTEKVYKGKVYLVQVRDKDQIDEAYKNIKIGIQVPKVESKDLN
jgi:hypothetical protein|tara:strand:- start:12 stop:311 length:300 start_codon:yes stop_codon:yes gene_type:complete